MPASPPADITLIGALLYSRNHFIQEPCINIKRKRFVNLIHRDISESWAIVEEKKKTICLCIVFLALDKGSKARVDIILDFSLP